MNHQQIKKALNDKGLTFAALASATGRHYQSLTAVSSRTSQSKPAALIISAALGLPVEEVFPDIPKYSETTIRNKEQSVKRAKEILIAAGLKDLVA